MKIINHTPAGRRSLSRVFSYLSVARSPAEVRQLIRIKYNSTSIISDPVNMKLETKKKVFAYLMVGIMVLVAITAGAAALI